MREAGIPYGYSPVVLTKIENIEREQAIYSHFIKATRDGFLYAKANVEEATAILRSYVTTYDLENIDLQATIIESAPYFGDLDTCGKMDSERVTAFLNWLVNNKLEEEAILRQTLFTNELFQ
jgi:ABC-type nitrate/sulfonate/bicarbonate transport system substrate-binding protein